MSPQLLALALALSVSFVSLGVEPMGKPVGQLQEKWQFPSDHLPIGLTLDGFHIASWNVLDLQYIEWVLDKNSQGLVHSQIADEHVFLPDSKLTKRDLHIFTLIEQMLASKRAIVALQEVNKPFLEALRAKLPSSVTLIEGEGNATLIDLSLFEIVEAKEVAGVFLDSPKRTFQEMLLKKKDTNACYKVINVHIPGNPEKPARLEFARYLAKTFDPKLTLVALGDMNFNEIEMKEAIQTAFGYPALTVYSPYCTNIHPYTFHSKAIDHFLVYQPVKNATVDAPGSVLKGLPQICALLQGTTLYEEFETAATLPEQKYTHSQFQQIKQVLQCKENKLRVVSYNMLTADNDERQDVENRWENRLPRLLLALREMDADVIGSQELSLCQLEELNTHLNSLYAFFGKKGPRGEYNGIFYKKQRLEPLSEKIWDMEGQNTLTAITFRDKQTQEKFTVFNTHLSFADPDAREAEARFVAEKAHAYAEKMPVIVTGDFNTFANRPDLTNLPFYDGDYITHILTKKSLYDARERSLLGHVGPIATFTNVPPEKEPFKGTGTPGVFLDHIFVSDEVTVLLHGTYASQIEGHFPSDHLPLIIDLLLGENS